MNFSKAMIEKAKTASSPEELMLLAAKEGIELTAAETSQYFALLNPSGALSDDELELVTGGKGGDESSGAKYKTGQHIRFCIQKSYMTGWIHSCEFLADQGVWYYTINLDSDQINHCNPTSSKQWSLALESSMCETEVLSD